MAKVSHKIEVYQILKEIVLDLQKKHSKFIGSLPEQENLNSKIIRKYPLKKLSNAATESEKLHYKFTKDKVKQIGLEAKEKFLSHFGDRITVDFNGHSKKETISFKELLEDDNYILFHNFFTMFSIGIINIDKNKNEPLDFLIPLIDPYSLNSINIFDGENFCSECGENLNLLLDLDTLEIKSHIYEKITDIHTAKKIIPEKCAYPNGVKDCSIKMDIPSGKIVILSNIEKLIDDKDLKNKQALFINKAHGSFTSIYRSNIANIYLTDFYLKYYNIALFQVYRCVKFIYVNKDKNKIDIKKSKKEHKQYSLVDTLNSDDHYLVALDLYNFEAFCKKHSKHNDVEKWISELDATIIDVDTGSYNICNYFLSNSKNISISFKKNKKIC